MAGMVEQVLAVFREGEAPSCAVKQPDPEMVLKLADKAGRSGMAGAGLAGNRGERAGLNDPHEGAEATQQIHDFPDPRTDTGRRSSD